LDPVKESLSLRNVRLIPVKSAKDMHKAVFKNSGCDIFIGTAAVSDFTPASFSGSKIKKNGKDKTLNLKTTPDIIGEFSKKYAGEKIVVGFAAETERVIDNASLKRSDKNLDIIVANDVGKKGYGFGSEFNRVTIIGRRGAPEKLPLIPKRKVAGILLDRIVKIFEQ
jgi:phosphopantothenoylcysteine decarboxylase/phosphopantothenate--cysteine ligase